MSLVRHTYEPDDEGRCQYPWTDSEGQERACRSRQRSSVLHDDPESDFREMHDHHGGDCMCFENEPGGYHAAMKRYVEAHGGR